MPTTFPQSLTQRSTIARSASSRFQKRRRRKVSYLSCKGMKLKDIGHWSERWATPRGTLDANAPVEDGVLVELSFWGTTIIGLAILCPDGKYFGSLRTTGNVYDRALEFLKQNRRR